VAQTRKTLAEAKLKELDLEERTHKTVAVEDVEKEWSDLVAMTRTKFLSLPSLLAGECNLSPEIEEKIRTRVMEALDALSRDEEENSGTNHP
jgi:hypothetical protein